MISSLQETIGTYEFSQGLYSHLMVNSLYQMTKATLSIVLKSTK